MIGNSESTSSISISKFTQQSKEITSGLKTRILLLQYGDVALYFFFVVINITNDLFNELLYLYLLIQ